MRDIGSEIGSELALYGKSLREAVERAVNRCDKGYEFSRQVALGGA